MLASDKVTRYVGQMAKKQTSSSASPTIQITFRIPEDWLGRADKLAKKLSHEGVVLTRTNGFRAAMAAGFVHLEKNSK